MHEWIFEGHNEVQNTGIVAESDHISKLAWTGYGGNPEFTERKEVAATMRHSRRLYNMTPREERREETKIVEWVLEVTERKEVVRRD
jgi:hypothetical protein